MATLHSVVGADLGRSDRKGSVLMLRLRLAMPMLITGICIWALWHMLDTGQLAGVPDALRDIPLTHLCAAAALAGLSFWAVGRYDAVAHRHFQTGVHPDKAKVTGTIAIALSQTLGFGVVSGAMIRSRMLPHLAPALALRLSVFVSLTFLLALGTLTALVCLMLPAPDWSLWPAALILAFIGLTLVALSFGSPLAWLRRADHVPSLVALGAIMLWAALDLIAASGALYMLIPAETLSFWMFVPVFLLALGAALLSSAPGGVGPFEVVLLTLLPDVPVAELVVGLIAFRALYYALPALAAAMALLQPFKTPPVNVPDTSAPLDDGPAELGILRQNGGTCTTLTGGVHAGLWHTPQTLTAFCDPTAPVTAQTLTALRARAHACNRIALFYKCNARTAAFARAQGWHVTRIAREAIIDPRAFTTEAPALRALRRKLRQAEKAGVTVTRPDRLPWATMAAIDAEWQTRHGSARGGTMGRYCPDYLATQDVYLAWQGHLLIAFATVHRSAQEACLDLMRHLPQTPSGTMHALVHAAILEATARDNTRFSLAAAPDFNALPACVPKRLKHWVDSRANGAGLRQFKSAFAPQWSARYAAAPGRLSLALALADIATEVHSPAPLPDKRPHKQDEEYELALNSAA